MKIILGLIFFAFGVFMVIKTESWLKAFGRIPFFEKNLGTEGGSRLGYKILGLILIFLGLIFVTGMGDNFMSSILSPLVPNN